MSENLILPVPRETIQEDIKVLNNYITVANSVTLQSTFSQIRFAQNHLYMARGLFGSMIRHKALANRQGVEDELNRIEEKIEFLLMEKSRNYRPKWRRS